jgi:uncharacterized membrane protein YtjA (UPF0391 family)
MRPVDQPSTARACGLLAKPPPRRHTACSSGRSFFSSFPSFGFTGVASTTRTVAKVLFFIALAVFLLVLVFGVMLGMLVF